MKLLNVVKIEFGKEYNLTEINKFFPIAAKDEVYEFDNRHIRRMYDAENNAYWFECVGNIETNNAGRIRYIWIADNEVLRLKLLGKL